MPDISADPPWFPRMVQLLEERAAEGRTITYGELAAGASVPGPGTIRRVTAALEALLERDHAGNMPLRAAAAVSKIRGGLPAPGFFRHCTALGLYFGPDEGEQARIFHRMVLDRLFVNNCDAGADLQL